MPEQPTIAILLLSSMSTSRKVEIQTTEPSPTIRAALNAVLEMHPGMRRWICAGEGLRPGVNVFVGRENVRNLQGLETTVSAGEEILIITPESGG